MPSSDVACLREPFQTAVRELLRRGAGIPGMRVVETCRTLAEQREKVAKGYSKTLNSFHLTGEAVDIYVDGYDQRYYDKLYEISKGIPFIIYPHYDRGWWKTGFIDRMHFEYDRTKTKGGFEFMTESEVNDAYWDLSEAVYVGIMGRSLQQTEGDAGHWREVNELKRLKTKIGGWFIGKLRSPEAQTYLKKTYGSVNNPAAVEAILKIKELVRPF